MTDREKWQLYEEKKRVLPMGLTPEEYDRVIKKILKELGL
jgi:hypothetical protein